MSYCLVKGISRKLQAHTTFLLSSLSRLFTHIETYAARNISALEQHTGRLVKAQTGVLECGSQASAPESSQIQ